MVTVLCMDRALTYEE